MCIREFERVLKKVRQGCLKGTTVRVDVEKRVDYRNGEFAGNRVRIKTSSNFRIGDEGRHGKNAPVAFRSYSYFVDGAIDKHGQGTHAALQYRTCCPAHVHVAELQSTDSETCG